MRAAQRATALAPMIKRRRSVRSPLFKVSPSVGLPPVDRCNGVGSSQAAKSRPLAKVCVGGAKALIAAAVCGCGGSARLVDTKPVDFTSLSRSKANRPALLAQHGSRSAPVSSFLHAALSRQ